MIGDLFDSPWKILIVAVVLIVLFGSKKLPHAARSLGQSMRILKSEVQGLHEDEPASGKHRRFPRHARNAAQPMAAPAPAPDKQAAIDALQQQIRDLQRAAATDTPPANVGAAAESQRTRSPARPGPETLTAGSGHGETPRCHRGCPHRRRALRALAAAAEPRGPHAAHGSPP